MDHARSIKPAADPDLSARIQKVTAVPLYVLGNQGTELAPLFLGTREKFHDYFTTFVDSDGVRGRNFLLQAVCMGAKPGIVGAVVPSTHRGPSKRELAAAAESAAKEERLRVHRAQRRLIHVEMEQVRGLPLSRSLVRLAFKDPLPGLERILEPRPESVESSDRSTLKERMD
jgi:hypothetical protein